MTRTLVELLIEIEDLETPAPIAYVGLVVEKTDSTEPDPATNFPLPEAVDEIGMRLLLDPSTRAMA